MDLDYYTLEQAARRLDCHADDLLYQIENENLFPCVHVKSRWIMLVEETQEGIMGRGTCWYTGILEVKWSDIQRILESTSTNIPWIMKILQPSRIEKFQPNCCYKSESYKDVFHITDWLPWNTDEIPKTGTVSCLGIEQEARSPIFINYEEKGITEIEVLSTDEKLRETTHIEKIDLSKEREYIYLMNSFDKYSKEKLRISHSGFEAFKKSGFYNPHSEKLDVVKGPKGSTAFSQLLRRIKSEQQDISALKVLSILKGEINSTAKHYDLDDILLEIDQTHIRWITNNNKVSEFKITSLGPTLSRMKS